MKKIKLSELPEFFGDLREENIYTLISSNGISNKLRIEKLFKSGNVQVFFGFVKNVKIEPYGARDENPFFDLGRGRFVFKQGSEYLDTCQIEEDYQIGKQVRGDKLFFNNSNGKLYIYFDQNLKSLSDLAQEIRGIGEDITAYDTVLDLSLIYGKQLGKDWKAFASIKDLSEALIKCATGKQDHTHRFIGMMKADINGIILFINQTVLSFKDARYIQYITGPVTVGFSPNESIIFSDEVHTLYRIIERGNVKTDWTDPLSDLYLASTLTYGHDTKIRELEERISKLENQIK